MIEITSPRLCAQEKNQPIWYIVAGPEHAISAHLGWTAVGKFKALLPEDTRRLLQEAFPSWKPAS